MTVLVRNNRLAVDVPGQTVFELHVPDEKGRRALRIRESLAVAFDEDTRLAVASDATTR